MYKTILVKQMIDEGAQLLGRLDARGIPVRAALWYDDPEKLAWKLVIVTSVASNPGPLEAYLQIQSAMTGLDLGVSLDDIVVMSPTSRKFEDLRRTMEGATQGAFLHPIDPSHGTVFDDAYVYRWLDQYGQAHAQ
jgi:hypothetical protein